MYPTLKQQKVNLKEVVDTLRHLEEEEPERMKTTYRDLELTNQLK